MIEDRYSKKIQYLPIILIEIYFIFTIIIFEFGPVKWNVNNKFTLYTFLIVYQIFLVFGYILGIKSKKHITRKISIDLKKYFTIYINSALIIYIAITLMEIIRVANSFNPATILETIINGIFNSSEQYYNKFSLNQSDLIGGRIFTFLSTGLSFYYWPVLPVAIYKFKQLKIYQKVLTIILILIRICTGLVIGTNKFVFDPVIILGTIIVFKLIKSRKKILNKKNVLLLLIVIICLIIAFSYFISAITSRVNGLERYEQGYKNNSIDFDKIKDLPYIIQEALVITDLYLAQGYYGMSLALHLDFIPCYGIGNNNFVLSNLEEALNIDVRARTYQERVAENYNWGATENWHTIYTWFANDVSFYGVAIIMLIIGFLLAKVWKSSLKGNIFAIALLPLYTIMFIFMSCNNQIFSLPASFTSFIFLTLCWLLISPKRKEKRNGDEYDKRESNTKYKNCNIYTGPSINN